MDQLLLLLNGEGRVPGKLALIRREFLLVPWCGCGSTECRVPVLCLVHCALHFLSTSLLAKQGDLKQKHRWEKLIFVAICCAILSQRHPSFCPTCAS